MAILTILGAFLLVGGASVVGELRGFGIALLVIGALLEIIAFSMVKPPYR